VNERQYEGTAVDHHTFAEEAGPDERHLLGGAVVKPVDDVDTDHDQYDRDDQPEDELADQDP
jgi:hypothetical protein